MGKTKHFIIAAAAVLVLAAGAPVAIAGCDPGDKLDSTTPDQARKKIEAGGYSAVHDLKRGCDNVWHAAAMKDGAPIRVVLTPDGQIYRDGD